MDIVVEMDYVNAVNLILSNDLNICHPMAGLVSSCKRLLSQIPKCFLHHIYREKNAVANRLAAWSHDLDLGCWFLEDNPTWLGPLLLDDSIRLVKSLKFDLRSADGSCVIGGTRTVHLKKSKKCAHSKGLTLSAFASTYHVFLSQVLLILLLLWSTTPRITDHRLRGSTSTSSSLSSSLALPQRSSTITGQVRT
ncbi:hypothetical protein L3X38_029716 [Prunus dulcis]|uniref:RNase H type-1 domain-containing protein n=1 Tax=Prunus dulcis TaxID=3755 RepID=A0AAD4VSD8_PRUDU|nr:hypothetical protein L3X38_029716 [Prunus dulcis]